MMAVNRLLLFEREGGAGEFPGAGGPLVEEVAVDADRLEFFRGPRQVGEQVVQVLHVPDGLLGNVRAHVLGLLNERTGCNPDLAAGRKSGTLSERRTLGRVHRWDGRTPISIHPTGYSREGRH